MTGVSAKMGPWHSEGGVVHRYHHGGKLYGGSSDNLSGLPWDPVSTERKRNPDTEIFTCLCLLNARSLTVTKIVVISG